MAQEKRNRLAEWLLLAREQVPIRRQHLREWLTAVRAEPSLIWQTPAVRYATYTIAGLFLLMMVGEMRAMIGPPPSVTARAAATTADFRVKCSSGECGHDFVLRREFGFRKFPVECPQCRRETGVLARQCHSADCKGRWRAPEGSGRELGCPVCGESLP